MIDKTFLNPPHEAEVTLSLVVLMNINIFTKRLLASWGGGEGGEVVKIIVSLFNSVSSCILERVFCHLEGMCSDCKEKKRS